MAEIVNLRRARKAKARDVATRTADANRAAFGQTKAEREATVAESKRRDRLLDDSRRQP